MTLKEASELLGVHPGTLRNWADQGDVPVARTPGGHRRFRRSDVSQLLQPEPQDADSALLAPDGAANAAIAHVRQDLPHLFHDPKLAPLSTEEHMIFRDGGRRLVHLAVQYVARRNGHGAILEQAADIGRVYGDICARHSLGLSETVRAFSSFREVVLDATCPSGTAMHSRDQEPARIRREMRQFFDAPFYAMLDAYERSRPAWIEPTR
jgi:excisionase family DNA binding protein